MRTPSPPVKKSHMIMASWATALKGAKASAPASSTDLSVNLIEISSRLTLVQSPTVVRISAVPLPLLHGALRHAAAEKLFRSEPCPRLTHPMEPETGRKRFSQLD